MPPPSLRSRSGPARDSWKMALVLVVTVGLLAGGGAFWWWAKGKRIDIDSATLCPRSGATAVHAVLIDRSDPISGLQATRVRQVLDRAVADIAIGGLLTLYVAESDGVEALRPVLALCNPGRDANPLYENPRHIRERFERDFKARLDDSVGRLLVPATRQTSPIMESIKAICIDAFGAIGQGVPLQLTIISDMVQHSPVASHYRDRDFEALLRSPRLQTMRADCKGAAVEIVYLLRPTQRGQPGVQTRLHQSFWDRYLQLMNARPRSMDLV